MQDNLIEKFESFGIGLLREGGVVLEFHNSNWPQLSEFEINRICKMLNHSGFKFYHIGSTSIPNIKAKPILDILITAPSIALFDQCKSNFEELGYEYKGEYGISGRRYCVLYNKEKSKGFVHIHGYEEGHSEITKHLAFRDYLQSHLEIAKNYEKLKIELSNDPKNSRTIYTELKSNLILQILSEAMVWKNLSSK